MKVVHINSYSNGSTGHIASSIHSALLDSGNESLFAFGNGPDIVRGGYRIGSKFDFFLHTLTTLLTGLHGYSSAFATRRLVKKLKKFNPDIVHLHNLHGGYLNLKILFNFLKKSNIKTVVTVHDCWLYTGKCYHYYEAKCDKFLDKCGKCPQLSMYPKSYFFDFTPKMLKDKKKLIGSLENLYAITISKWLQEEVERSFMGKYPVTTIRNGVNDIYRISDRELNTELDSKLQNKFVILGVASSWNEHKGISDFLKLSELLSEDEVIVLVGNINNRSLPDNVIAIDHTSKEELVAIYNAASVYVSMSCEETFGLTIAEALSCGTPAIVYQATACPEMITSEEVGYVAAPHNIEQVYEYICKIKTTSVNRIAISQKAQELYSTQRMLDEYLSFYRGVIE